MALFAERADEGEEMMALRVGAEYGLFVVAALGEMKPVAASNWGGAKRSLRGILPSVHKCVLEGKILTYFAKNAFGRWFCAETKS